MPRRFIALVGLVVGVFVTAALIVRQTAADGRGAIMEVQPVGTDSAPDLSDAIASADAVRYLLMRSEVHDVLFGEQMDPVRDIGYRFVNGDPNGEVGSFLIETFSGEWTTVEIVNSYATGWGPDESWPQEHIDEWNSLGTSVDLAIAYVGDKVIIPFGCAIVSASFSARDGGGDHQILIPLAPMPAQPLPGQTPLRPGLVSDGEKVYDDNGFEFITEVSDPDLRMAVRKKCDCNEPICEPPRVMDSEQCLTYILECGTSVNLLQDCLGNATLLEIIAECGIAGGVGGLGLQMVFACGTRFVLIGPVGSAACLTIGGILAGIGTAAAVLCWEDVWDWLHDCEQAHQTRMNALEWNLCNSN